MQCRGALVRVGIDHSYGNWNAPVDPVTNEFIYVPIPEEKDCAPTLATSYPAHEGALAAFAEEHTGIEPGLVTLPEKLAGRNCHLDPDFESLTYGDNGV